jgi:hypothetical protein
MRISDLNISGQRKRLIESAIRAVAFTASPAALAAGLIVLTASTDARTQPEEIEFSELRIILETNATDCDTGIQLFFDGDPWKEVRVEDPDGRRILHVKAMGGLGGFGLTEQFNESNEPVMQELLDGPYAEDCEDEAEFTLEELFELFPEGVYEFEGKTVEGEELDGEAFLSHAIPAPPTLVAPEEDDEVNANLPVTIEWMKEEAPILAGYGPIEIVGFHVVVEQEDADRRIVFTADLGPGETKVTVPPEFLEPGASYKFEVLQIDVSGNQTIAEREFATAP